MYYGLTNPLFSLLQMSGYIINYRTTYLPDVLSGYKFKAPPSVSEASCATHREASIKPESSP